MKFIPSNASDFVPASHEDPKNPGVLKRVIATAAELNAGQVPMLNWSQLAAGKSFQLHYHEDMQEIFVLLRGTVTMQVGNETVTMNPGDTVIVEPTEIHQMSNASDGMAEYLVFGIASGKGGKTVIV